MNSLQLFLIAAGLFLISWVSSEGIVNRGYLPVITTVSQPRTFQYPSYKPLYTSTQYQPYNPSYITPYYPHYTSGYLGLGGYQQQQHVLGQHYNTGNHQHLNTGTSVGVSGLGSHYPNVNLDLITSIKPKVDVIDTIYDANGAYVYGKKK